MRNGRTESRRKMEKGKARIKEQIKDRIKKQGMITGIDAVRFVAALCVVAIHSFMEYQNITDAYTVRILTRWAVPFFFVVTGYFLKEDVKRFAGFFARIFLEYVFFTIIYAILCHEDIFSPWRFFSALRSGIIMPFWYFPTLLMCMTFVWVLIKTVKKWQIIVAICAALFLMALMGHTYANLQAFGFFQQSIIMKVHHRVIGEVTTRDGIFWGSLFISIGYALRKKGEEPGRRDWTLPKKIIWLSVSFILSVAEICLIVYFHTGGKDITVFTIPVVILLFSIALEMRIPKSIGEYLRYTGNGVFLIHYFFLELFMKRGYLSAPLFLLTLAASVLMAGIYAACKCYIKTKQARSRQTLH